ncbi:rap guanine nucleotide exchange factor 1-like [Sycon ciliatum]|uniref:rap guanine nucleotide exchange factor 1-like n=1 Tax=Sycon ciliatum TaxID=27933 RepID=UPI0031F6F243
MCVLAWVTNQSHHHVTICPESQQKSDSSTNIVADQRTSSEEPRKIIDNMNGFKNYRDGLAASGSPCIPYLGLYLQDLTFINIGNTNMLDDNKDCVNFAKRWRQFKVMCKIKQYQQHGYESTKRDEDIIQYFNGCSSHLGEEELWERSMLLKPRAPS